MSELNDLNDYMSLPAENLDQPRHRKHSGDKGLVTKHEYYWIKARSPETLRPIIIGPYDTQDEASQVGLRKIASGNFEVVPLYTRNLARANHILKYQNFSQFRDLEEVGKRAIHERGLK